MYSGSSPATLLVVYQKVHKRPDGGHDCSPRGDRGCAPSPFERTDASAQLRDSRDVLEPLHAQGAELFGHV